MPMSNFPNGFRNGVAVRKMPILNAYPRDVFWVDSNAGSNGNDGSFNQPFSTLDYAVGRCTANRGDIIMVKAGHAESLTADSAVDIDVAGVSVIGLGAGSDRPTFTFTTAVTADFKLAANNVSIENLLFKAGIDALTGPIEVSGDDCAVINCEYQDNGTSNYETTDVLVTASTPLRLLVDGFVYRHDGGAGGTQNQSVIQLNAADHAILRNCWLVADSGTGVIEDATTSDQILIENCVVENSETSPTVAVALTATTTGTIRNTSLRVASGTTYLTADNDMQMFEVFGTGTDATTGEKVGTQLAGDIEGKVDVIDGYHDVPTADVTTNSQMRDVVGNKTDAAVTAVGTTKTVVAYIKGVLSWIGTITNTGGTATLGAAIGDVANDSIAARLDDVGSDVNATTTDSIQGKIGTDTEMADRSVYDLLNGGGPASAATAAAPANDVSLYGVARYISERQAPRLASKAYADLTGYDTAAAFTVTGDVKVRVWGVVGAAAITSTSGTTTLSVGTTENAAGIIAATTIDNSDFDATDVWVDNDPASDCETLATAWTIIGGGADIILTRNVDDLTAGTLTLYCEWTPLSSDGAVVAA